MQLKIGQGNLETFWYGIRFGSIKIGFSCEYVGKLLEITDV